MKKFLLPFLVVFTTFFLYSCEVESETASTSGNNEISSETEQNVSVFMDSKEQKGALKLEDGTKIDLETLKNDENIVTGENGTKECVSSEVTYTQKDEEIKEEKESKTLDVTLDLTSVGKGADFEKITSSRVEQVKSLLSGELYENIKLIPGDTMLLRFIGTADYGINGKNLPLNDKISITLKKKNTGKTIKIEKISCIKNERKKLIYLKFKKENIKIEDSNSEVKNEKIEIKKEIDSTQKFEVYTEEEIMDIVSKSFDFRSEDDKYTKGSYILEFLDKSDVLATNSKNTETFIFSDANFQLHPNFLKNYANPYNVKLDEIGDFNPEVYNKYPQAFSSFYRHLVNDPYVTTIKQQKCQNSNSLYLIGTKYGTNKYFENIMQVFYKELLPSCKITFN